MFDIGWSELLLIGIVALIAIGPKELPGALRTLGQWMGKVRRMASEFQNQFHEAMREAELADLKKEVDEMASKAQSYAHFDPIDDIRKDIEKAAGPPPDLDTLTDTAASSAPSASPPPAATPPASAPAATETPPPAEPAAPQSTAPVNTPDAGRAA
jgi:sec-independent protein translocase protein TatB